MRNIAYVMFTYTKCLIVFIWFVFGNFWKIKLWLFGKNNYTDFKVICGVADKGIMKSDRLKLRLVIMRHSSLSLGMKYIEYRVTNCIMFVIIKCKNINIYFHSVQLQCF